MEECAQCTLGAYASGMAMAFAANLLVTAWASFYRLLQNRQRELATEAEGLARNPLIEEEVGIEILQEQISKWRRYRRILWKFGFWTSLVSALYLYMLTWHFSPDTTVCCGLWLPWTLWVAAYAGPSMMAAMALVGMWGTNATSGLNDKLQEKAKNKKAESEAEQRAVDERLRRLAERTAQTGSVRITSPRRR